MLKLFLLKLCALGLILSVITGCATTTVHVVAPRDYNKLSYQEKVKFLGAIYKVNEKNLNIKNGIRRINKKLYVE